mgnify:CR=1 FL=1
MYKVGKVYKTIGGTPAKILWVDSTVFQSYNPSAIPKIYVLHQPYTRREIVLQHNLDGVMPALNLYDLTPIEYVQEFKN